MGGKYAEIIRKEKNMPLCFDVVVHTYDDNDGQWLVMLVLVILVKDTYANKMYINIGVLYSLLYCFSLCTNI